MRDESQHPPQITITANVSNWRRHTATVRRAANFTIHEVPQKAKSSLALSILLTNDTELRKLNKQYRGKNKPTNVLSFPDGEVDESGALYLGDIALAYETIAREAKEQKKKFVEHLAHLTMHGILHLLGYDHETARDAKRMESLEIKLLAAMGIANPYESV